MDARFDQMATGFFAADLRGLDADKSNWPRIHANDTNFLKAIPEFLPAGGISTAADVTARLLLEEEKHPVSESRVAEPAKASPSEKIFKSKPKTLKCRGSGGSGGFWDIAAKSAVISQANEKVWPTSQPQRPLLPPLPPLPLRFKVLVLTLFWF
jgi:hypothetical protein